MEEEETTLLSIDFNDFLAVLNLAVPYLVALGIVIVLAVTAMVFSRKKDKAMKYLIRSQALVAMLLALVIVANLIAFGPMSTLIGLATGSGTISDETTAAANVVAQEVADEGFVLLENEGLLPLAGTSNLNLFGWASANPLFGGAGSGGINDLYPIVSLKQGLENSGFKVNQDLFDFYYFRTLRRPRDNQD